MAKAPTSITLSSTGRRDFFKSQAARRGMTASELFEVGAMAWLIQTQRTPQSVDSQETTHDGTSTTE